VRYHKLEESSESAGISKLLMVVRSLLGNSLLELSGNSSLSLGVGESVLSEPLLFLGVLLDELTGSLLDLLSDGCLLLSLDSVGVLSDLSVNLLVESLAVGGLCLGEACLPLGELLLEEILVLLLEEVHVGLHVVAEDVVSVLLGVVGAVGLALLDHLLASLSGGGLLLLEVVAGESLGVVGHVDAAVNCTLEGTEDSVTGGGSHETHVEESAEGSLLFVDTFLLAVDVEELAVGSLNTLVETVKLEVLEESAGDEEAGGVGGSVVGETGLETESPELLGVSLSEDSIALDGGVDDLNDDAAVGSSHAQSVLLGVVLVLVLLDQSSSRLVVSLSLASASELDLISRVVGSGLHGLDECHVK
jgi:hypothetical protein